MVICLEQGANDLHMAQMMPLSPPSSLASLKSGMTFLVPDYPGCPGKEAVQRESVCITKLMKMTNTKIKSNGT